MPGEGHRAQQRRVRCVVNRRNTSLAGPLSATTSVGLHAGIREAKMRAPYGRQHDGDDSREATWARVLKANYDEAVQGPMPDRIRELLDQLKDAESRKR
jgi:hypothetical protein